MFAATPPLAAARTLLAGLAWVGRRKQGVFFFHGTIRKSVCRMLSERNVMAKEGEVDGP